MSTSNKKVAPRKIVSTEPTERMGRYLYAPGWMGKKTFEGGRSFTVLVAGAYNAGVIGPEHNGIVVHDDDNGGFLFDQHLRADSGWYGPTLTQQLEFRRIMNMDWAEFSKFCRELSGKSRVYRHGGSPDIDTGTGPDPGNSQHQALVSGKPSGKPGRDIRSPEMMKANADKKCPYKFPLKTRDDMIVFLTNHKMYSPSGYGGDWCMAWDINTLHDRLDLTGKGAEKTDDRFDGKWKEYLESDPELFGEVCSRALAQFTEGDYSTYPGDDQGQYKFFTAGRSGGHLCLESWGAPMPGSGHYPMSFRDPGHHLEWMQEIDSADLAKLYCLAVTVDHDTSRPARVKELAFQYNFIRSNMEEQWAAELEPEASTPSP
jgi:hypothetical protein